MRRWNTSTTIKKTTVNLPPWHDEAEPEVTVGLDEFGNIDSITRADGMQVWYEDEAVENYVKEAAIEQLDAEAYSERDRDEAMREEAYEARRELLREESENER